MTEMILFTIGAAFAGSLLTPYVNAQMTGKTGVTATRNTAGNGKTAGTTTAGEATGVKPTVTEAASGTVDDALEQFYDDIFESSYGEPFDPVKEQAIAEPGEIAGTAEVVKSGSETLEQLKQYIKNGVVKENNIISQMDENTQIIFRNDTGEFAHPINSHGYSNVVNHYNIEIQIRTAAGKWKSKWSYHIIMDNNGNIIKVFD